MREGCASVRNVLPERRVKTRNELEYINGQLSDHLQIQLWTGRYTRSEGGGRVSGRALEGCMEIVGYPDSGEKVMAESAGMAEVESLIREAVTMRERKTTLLGQLHRNINLLMKRYNI